MTRQRKWTFAVAVMVLMLVGGMAWADVTSRAFTLSTRPGQHVVLPFELITDTAVAGVNGEFNYDPTRFDNPEFIRATGAGNHITLGNEVSPGKFRFVIYADPTAPIIPGPVVFYLRLHAISVLPLHASETINFTISAASSPEGVSLPNTQFSPIQVNLLQASVDDWSIYQ